MENADNGQKGIEVARFSDRNALEVHRAHHETGATSLGAHSL